MDSRKSSSVWIWASFMMGKLRQFFSRSFCILYAKILKVVVMGSLPYPHHSSVDEVFDLVFIPMMSFSFSLQVLAAAQAGKHNEKRESYGDAIIIDPWGKVVARLPGISHFLFHGLSNEDIRGMEPKVQYEIKPLKCALLFHFQVD